MITARSRRCGQAGLVLCGLLALAGCAALPGADATGLPSLQAPGRAGAEMLRPDVFARSDRGLWDGRPTLGGVWVAHPDVTRPERVLIADPASGQSVAGALFRRERANPGPAFQISSEAAAALGLLAGAPVMLQVTALRPGDPAAPAAQAPAPQP